ncbi:SDR family oxidoreductase [Niabella drilacis]|uniref:NADP-dependent 3-hydroxy acid dehydrogenase YdfG n=1 Tax=Niabella drilacis (strain DSM 25811 / CCM 8410 / CCUG 62505 / LMG 26954 / E90) TaxID=1285928 RepID=A0A1G6I603_NIADE|nr:SDR family oxidoreductase [Niabella drilacis]SDC01924.1 NADP-dependent 3-hydroxy acid dehydrogenase YdfG [Niabella drilacis]
MKTIFITGASTGLGKATALLFHSKGWKVIATMRDVTKGSDLAKLENITVLSLDVTDPAQIGETAAKALTLGAVDVVFNNAGYGLGGPLENLTDSEIVQLFDTNMLGTIRVTKAFVPHFKERRQGLFIAATSMAGLMAVPFNTIYNASKFAIEGWTEGMFYELGLFNIGIKTVAPGIIKSHFGENAIWAVGEEYKEAFDRSMASFDFRSYFSTPEMIADIVYEAATDGKKQLRYVAGEDVNRHFAQYEELGRQGYVDQLATKVIK